MNCLSCTTFYDGYFSSSIACFLIVIAHVISQKWTEMTFKLFITLLNLSPFRVLSQKWHLNSLVLRKEYMSKLLDSSILSLTNRKEQFGRKAIWINTPCKNKNYRRVYRRKQSISLDETHSCCNCTRPGKIPCHRQGNEIHQHPVTLNLTEC